MSLFIYHFALTPELLVRLSWNFVLGILYIRGRSGANFSPIGPKKYWSSGGSSSLQRSRGARRRPDHQDGHLQQCVLLHSFNFGNLKDSPLCKWPFPKERRRPDHPDDHLQQSVILRPLDFGHPDDRPLCKWPFVKERRNNGREENYPVEQLSRWTIVVRDIVARDIVARNNCPEGHCSKGHCPLGTCCEGHCPEGHWGTLIYDGTGSI